MLGVGATIAGYQLESVLGRGGMGTVYLARHPRLPRSVALKLLNREVSADAELVRRFEQEADVVARLEHPSIVGVFDRGVDEDHLWIAMQYIRGTDAASWDGRAHPPVEAARLVGEIATALDFAHDHGVLHRDVKPANILIADANAGLESRALLTDFGIARLADANTKLTATGTFTATIAFGSPEQLSGEMVDARSDQYSLACTLFAILTGAAPFAATNPGQVVMGHLTQPVPRLTGRRADLPPAVDTVLARGMAKRRDERFGSCAEFTTAVRDALEGRHVAASSNPAVPTVTPPEPMALASVEPNRGWTPPPAMAPVPAHPPHPAAGHPWPAAPQRSPSAATAILAGIFTLLFGLIALGVLGVGVYETRKDVLRGTIEPGDPGAILALLFVGSIAALWLGSGSLLLMGRKAGRILTILCAVLSWGILALICVGIGSTGDFGPLAVFVPLTFIYTGVLACAVVPATKRWVHHRVALRQARRGR